MIFAGKHSCPSPSTSAKAASSTGRGTPDDVVVSDPCHQLIKRIRRLKGVGVVMEGEAAEAFQATQRTLGNAVEKVKQMCLLALVAMW